MSEPVGRCDSSGKATQHNQARICISDVGRRGYGRAIRKSRLGDGHGFSPVRITNVEAFLVQAPPEEHPFKIYRYPVTRVHPDAGVVGASFIRTGRDFLELLEHWVKPTLVGQDVFAVARRLKRLQMQREESGVQSWSGVEHAMWDAIGKIAGRPVAQFLGEYRDRLRLPDLPGIGLDLNEEAIQEYRIDE